MKEEGDEREEGKRKRREREKWYRELFKLFSNTSSKKCMKWKFGGNSLIIAWDDIGRCSTPPPSISKFLTTEFGRSYLEQTEVSIWDNSGNYVQ